MGAQTENSELIKRTFGKYLAMSILITLSATLGMMIDNVIAGNLLGSGGAGGHRHVAFRVHALLGVRRHP